MIAYSSLVLDAGGRLASVRATSTHRRLALSKRSITRWHGPCLSVRYGGRDGADRREVIYLSRLVRQVKTAGPIVGGEDQTHRHREDIDATRVMELPRDEEQGDGIVRRRVPDEIPLAS